MAHDGDSGWSSGSEDERDSGDPVADEARLSYNSGVPDKAASSSAEDADFAEQTQKPAMMAGRAYQLEMLEASLKRNTIVAACFFLPLPRAYKVLLTRSQMETGSGKTLV